MAFTVNGQAVTPGADVDPNMPLLWYLRDVLAMTGTKFGCGVAQCGACTVLIDGYASRACVTPIDSLEGAAVTTIEGLDGTVAKAVEAAWVAMEVPQCGYCQSGQVVAATALLTETPKPTDEDIDAAMDGNLCRCGTYKSIRAAVHRAADSMGA